MPPYCLNLLCDSQIAMKGQLNPDGYVMDFGDVKNVRYWNYMRIECKKLNQKFLLPMKSDVLTVSPKKLIHVVDQRERRQLGNYN
ncbi:hypothetical protein JH06_1372 [Blastocystis sp. subtype 4]|uniref:hypothetical protein n=1 Tax=Blastocystis sp. subtype 4 TaxID=944170 RepID=UPI000711A2EA|nr:hypothetical protein JH06_1372 [Blastocystis sp. subtype 4]KNB45768.1 hypothetical protein JH06_1372 [Blastocystis sp. subtype 4]|eukprot:XP_014529211.1 hypothetical protein JH06_1372 [Blastocystis sp. subtype 4]